MTFMLISKLVVTSSQLANGFVMLVQDSRMTVSMPISGIVIALEAKQYIFTNPSPSLKVSRPDGVVSIARPDQVAVVTEDIRRGLTGPVLLGGCVWVARKGRDK